LAKGTGGGLFATELSANVPTIRRIKPGKASNNVEWMGLVAHEDYAVRSSKRSPLAPGWLFFALALLAMGGAWLREGK